MRVEQISIFLENRAGRLAEVTSILSEVGINIRALSLADTTDFGVLRMIVDDTEKARNALKENGFTLGKHDVIAVEVPDKPGGLHQLLEMLSRRGVNVEYMYAFVRNSGDNAIMIFRFDDLEKAVQVLKDNDVQVIAGETVHQM